MSSFEGKPGPPVLPPHLLQIILNKVLVLYLDDHDHDDNDDDITHTMKTSQDTPLSCEPTLLPEPNHVMLNHLYALRSPQFIILSAAGQINRVRELSLN